MQYLIIYDNEGYVLSQINGAAREPVGIPFQWINIPNDYYLKKMDVSTSILNATPVLQKFNDIDIDTATLEELKAYQITKSKENLQNYFKTTTLKSICHKDILKSYSITEEKQNHLVQMINMTLLAIQANNTDFKPSWNATGEPCTYDWTLEELQQLAFEMEELVRPAVSRQQMLEVDINRCLTKEAVTGVNINF